MGVPLKIGVGEKGGREGERRERKREKGRKEGKEKGKRSVNGQGEKARWSLWVLKYSSLIHI